MIEYKWGDKLQTLHLTENNVKRNIEPLEQKQQLYNSGACTPSEIITLHPMMQPMLSKNQLLRESLSYSQVNYHGDILIAKMCIYSCDKALKPR